MRLLFILIRGMAYGAVLISLLFVRQTMPWWMLASTILIAFWCSYDQWKKHDTSYRVMQRGVWTESALILLLALLLHSSELLFLFLSPLSRTCIHLSRRESLMLGLFLSAAVIGSHYWLPAVPVWLWGQLAGLLVLGFYTSVLGLLMQQREAAKRLLSLDTFEREQRSKDEERVRLAGQLHDQTGQYWASIIRALDVALAVGESDPRRVDFMQKAREAAMHGLEDMRQTVHNWHDGLHTPEQWMRKLEQSAERIGSLTGVPLSVELHSPDWHLFPDPAQTAEAIARAAIEAVTNAIKHAQARSIAIKLHAAGGGASLIVSDDGAGFDDHSTTGNGIGLASMRQLAEGVGGTLDIAGGRGRGTTLFLAVPYRDIGGQTGT
jgi:signal transduction histidine kinase